jgi:branched-chain amino acid transport system ATP-binding protein
MNDVIAELRKVSVSYNSDIEVLREVNVCLKPGKIVGIIGPNGAGKSTVLNTMACMLRPRSGEVMISGKPVTGAAPHTLVSHGLAMVPQSRSLFLDLSVEDNLKLGCWPFRRDRARMKRALDEVYIRFPALVQRRNEAAGALSGGQRRFLEIARALVLSPRILLLDEPTAMIAPKLSTEIYTFIKELAGEGIAVGLVDQNVRGCIGVSDYIYVLELGRNSVEGSKEQFSSSDQMRSLIAGWLEFSGG